MAESIRVGTLLGATMIVAGAYQKAASQVRVTARFVDVATGEIKGSAKVDGSTSDFLSLQDKITAELVQVGGHGTRSEVQHFAKRVRPKVKSFKAIELYGDAVTQTDDKKKLELLKLSLNEDPQFVYASRDLDALEKRMKQYAAVSHNAQRGATAELMREARGREGSGAALHAVQHAERAAHAAGALAHAHRRVARVRRRSAEAAGGVRRWPASPTRRRR